MTGAAKRQCDRALAEPRLLQRLQRLRRPCPRRQPRRRLGVAGHRHGRPHGGAVVEASLLDRGAPGSRRRADLGFGRIVVSEIEVPNMLVNLV